MKKFDIRCSYRLRVELCWLEKECGYLHTGKSLVAARYVRNHKSSTAFIGSTIVSNASAVGTGSLKATRCTEGADSIVTTISDHSKQTFETTPTSDHNCKIKRKTLYNIK